MDGQEISVAEEDNGDGTINVNISPHRPYSPLQELFDRKFKELDGQSHTQ